MTQPRPPVKAVEGELIEPSLGDRLAAVLNSDLEAGRLALPHQLTLPDADLDAGRAICAALGAGIGSLWKSGGAGVGAFVAAALYDMLLDSNLPRRQRRHRP